MTSLQTEVAVGHRVVDVGGAIAVLDGSDGGIVADGILDVLVLVDFNNFHCIVEVVDSKAVGDNSSPSEIDGAAQRQYGVLGTVPIVGRDVGTAQQVVGGIAVVEVARAVAVDRRSEFGCGTRG